MHDTKKREQFIRLRARGKSIRAIAKALEINKNTVWSWNGEYRNEIADARQAIIDLTLNEIGADRIERIKTAGEFFNHLKETIRGDNAQELAPDKKKIECYIKLYQLLDKEDSADTIYPVRDEPEEIEEQRPMKLITTVPRPKRRLDNDKWLEEQNKKGENG